MTKLYLNTNNTCKLIRKSGSFKNKTFAEMSQLILDNLRLGTSFEVINKNKQPLPHRGSYYLLYLEEFNMATLLYLDVSKDIRILYYGDMENAVYSLYRGLATGTTVKFLKSEARKTYRVVDDAGEEVSFEFKNRDAEICNQKYLKIFDAINYAVKLHKETGKTYSVVTKSGTTLITV